MNSPKPPRLGFDLLASGPVQASRNSNEDALLPKSAPEARKGNRGQGEASGVFSPKNDG